MLTNGAARDAPTLFLSAHTNHGTRNFALALFPPPLSSSVSAAFCCVEKKQQQYLQADGSSLECDCCNQTNGPFIVNCGFLREYIPGDFRADPKPMITTVSEAKINNEKLAAKVDEL